jgi:bacterioferritin-associated ferredoxin
VPRLVFGSDDRDQYTLRRVSDLGLTVAFECQNCRKVSQKDVLELIERYGLGTRLGDLRPKAKCSRCGRRAAEVLMRARRQGRAGLVASPAEGDKIGTICAWLGTLTSGIDPKSELPPTALWPEAEWRLSAIGRESGR